MLLRPDYDRPTRRAGGCARGGGAPVHPSAVSIPIHTRGYKRGLIRRCRGDFRVARACLLYVPRKVTMALIAASMSSLGFAISPLHPIPVQSGASSCLRLHTVVRMQDFANDGEEVKTQAF